MTFPKNVGQIPCSIIIRTPDARYKPANGSKFRSNYLDVDNDALYPFGYGLSYTTFQYSDIALSTPSMEQNGSITAWSPSPTPESATVRSSATVHPRPCGEHHPSGTRTERLRENIPSRRRKQDGLFQDYLLNCCASTTTTEPCGRTGRI